MNRSKALEETANNRSYIVSEITEDAIQKEIPGPASAEDHFVVSDDLLQSSNLEYERKGRSIAVPSKTRVYILAYAVAVIQFCSSFHLYGMSGVFQN